MTIFILFFYLWFHHNSEQNIADKCIPLHWTNWYFLWRTRENVSNAHPHGTQEKLRFAASIATHEKGSTVWWSFLSSLVFFSMIKYHLIICYVFFYGKQCWMVFYDKKSWDFPSCRYAGIHTFTTIKWYFFFYSLKMFRIENRGFLKNCSILNF